jgi:hypothetical protein
MEFTKVSKDVDGGGDFQDWKFNEMPELEGTLIEHKTGVGQFGKQLWRVSTPQGESMTVWESAVITKLLSQVTIGSYIKIVFLGKKKNAKGTASYNDFDLFVASGQPAPQTQQPIAQPVQTQQVAMPNGQAMPQAEPFAPAQPTQQPQGGQNFGQPIDDVPF